MDSAKYIPDESAATLMMISFPALVWVVKRILPVASMIFQSMDCVARPRLISWFVGLGVAVMVRCGLGEWVPTFIGAGIYG